MPVHGRSGASFGRAVGENLKTLDLLAADPQQRLAQLPCWPAAEGLGGFAAGDSSAAALLTRSASRLRPSECSRLFLSRSSRDVPLSQAPLHHPIDWPPKGLVEEDLAAAAGRVGGEHRAHSAHALRFSSRASWGWQAAAAAAAPVATGGGGFLESSHQAVGSGCGSGSLLLEDRALLPSVYPSGVEGAAEGGCSETKSALLAKPGDAAGVAFDWAPRRAPGAAVHVRAAHLSGPTCALRNPHPFAALSARGGGPAASLPFAAQDSFGGGFCSGAEAAAGLSAALETRFAAAAEGASSWALANSGGADCCGVNPGPAGFGGPRDARRRGRRSARRGGSVGERAEREQRETGGNGVSGVRGGGPSCLRRGVGAGGASQPTSEFVFLCPACGKCFPASELRLYASHVMQPGHSVKQLMRLRLADGYFRCPKCTCRASDLLGLLRHWQEGGAAHHGQRILKRIRARRPLEGAGVSQQQQQRLPTDFLWRVLPPAAGGGAPPSASLFAAARDFEAGQLDAGANRSLAAKNGAVDSAGVGAASFAAAANALTPAPRRAALDSLTTATSPAVPSAAAVGKACALMPLDRTRCADEGGSTGSNPRGNPAAASAAASVDAVLSQLEAAAAEQHRQSGGFVFDTTGTAPAATTAGVAVGSAGAGTGDGSALSEALLPPVLLPLRSAVLHPREVSAAEVLRLQVAARHGAAASASGPGSATESSTSAAAAFAAADALAAEGGGGAFSLSAAQPLVFFGETSSSPEAALLAAGASAAARLGCSRGPQASAAAGSAAASGDALLSASADLLRHSLRGPSVRLSPPRVFDCAEQQQQRLSISGPCCASLRCSPPLAAAQTLADNAAATSSCGQKIREGGGAPSASAESELLRSFREAVERERRVSASKRADAFAASVPAAQAASPAASAQTATAPYSSAGQGESLEP